MKKIKTGGLRRRLTIGAAGARSGLGLLSSKASSLLLPKDQQAAHNEAALSREAQRFVKELGELKGAYVKIGQMLALYGEHLLPAPVTQALHTLEAHTEAIDWSEIKPSIAAALGENFDETLTIEQEAFAAASLAQVHKAHLVRVEKAQSSTGPSALCLKVLYPGIAGAIDDDFKNVMQMLSLTRWIESGRQLDALTKELKTHLLREVDYRYELSTAQKMTSLLNGDERYTVPKYYPKLCSESLLTMDFVDAYEVTHPKVQALSQDRRNALAMSMLELFFKEAFEWRLMQTDPNFGNYRIKINSKTEQDVLVLLDFGAVHSLSKSFSESLRATILAAQQGDIERTILGLIDLNCLRASDSQNVKESFAQFCVFILEPFNSDLSSLDQGSISDDGFYDWQASKLLKRAGRLGSQGMLVKGFVVPPPEFMLMVRKLTGVFTFVSALGAKLDSAHLLDPYR